MIFGMRSNKVNLFSIASKIKFLFKKWNFRCFRYYAVFSIFILFFSKGILAQGFSEVMKELLSRFENMRTSPIQKHWTIDPSNGKIPNKTIFNKNSVECKNWVEAHKLCCEGESSYLLAEELLKNTKHVSDDEFIYKMNTSLEEFNSFAKKHPKKKFVFPINFGKSDEWLATRFKDKLSEMLGSERFDFIDQYDLEKFLRHNKDTDVAFLNDGIYSGEQMRSYLDKISEYFGKAYEGRRAHIIVPFGTDKGVNSLSHVLEHITVYRSEKMQSISDFYPNIEQNDVPYPLESTPTFFDHRVADAMSIPAKFFRKGEIACLNDSYRYKSCRYLSFSCVPKIERPYVRESSIIDEDENNKRICDKSSNPKLQLEGFHSTCGDLNFFRSNVDNCIRTHQLSCNSLGAKVDTEGVDPYGEIGD